VRSTSTLIQETTVETISRITIIRRDDIPSISEIVENGKVHSLGAHRDFRRSPALAAFIPENARLAMSWTRLKKGQRLEPHVHPIRSMIIICDGAGTLLGDMTAPLEAGDAVIVPPGCHHGFEGGAPGGFGALSVQFESSGLYEHPDKPQVAFDPGATIAPE